jgi:hypothetical protein
VIQTRSALTLAGDTKYDACLSSPPYATRIDYVKNSLAELAVLGVSDSSLQQLRRESTGTPIVRGITREKRELRSVSAENAVRRVEKHESHGSANYYGPWLRNYLNDLDASLALIDGAITRQGRIAILVQDSHYKAIHLDLQLFVIEMLEGLGRKLIVRQDFDVPRSMARMNPAAKKHLVKRSNFESLLVLEGYSE